ALLFGLPFFFVLRELLEKAFALQEVEVDGKVLAWSRRTKLWSRRRQLKLTEITDVVPDTPKLGEHGVTVISRGGARPKVLRGLSTESALESARELKRRLRA
ncbi:MAG TPA: hypothetical protein VLI55_15205, partial [Bryobacteraceae bacterium]|nr:hypothetical protein [Bryobacteraceae bacterium]